MCRRFAARQAGFLDAEKRSALHRLKNGALAHRLTDEDRRKAAAVTNEIRRAKRELVEQLELNREIEEMLARNRRRREKRRQRYLREKQWAALDRRLPDTSPEPPLEAQERGKKTRPNPGQVSVPRQRMAEGAVARGLADEEF